MPDMLAPPSPTGFDVTSAPAAMTPSQRRRASAWFGQLWPSRNGRGSGGCGNVCWLRSGLILPGPITGTVIEGIAGSLGSKSVGKSNFVLDVRHSIN